MFTMQTKAICKFWLKGRCDRYPCHFSHNPDDNVDCRYWLNGNCPFDKRCRYKHNVFRLSDEHFEKLTQLSFPKTPEFTADYVGFVILKYYLDAVLHLSNINFSSDLISLMASYVTDLHYSTIPRINEKMLCPICKKLERYHLRCAVCKQYGIYYNLVYVDNEIEPILICINQTCQPRIGLTIQKSIPQFPQIGTINKPHQPRKVRNRMCCTGFMPIGSDMGIEPCVITTNIKKNYKYNIAELRTASFFNFKPFSGVVISTSKYYLKEIFPCRCITRLDEPQDPDDMYEHSFYDPFGDYY
jgi:hypothetical protein